MSVEDSKSRRIKSLIIGISGIFFSATTTLAGVCSEKFSWLANSEDNIAGYNIHYGQTNGGPYSNTLHIDATIPVNGRIGGTVSDLNCGARYYFVCTAVSDSGLESDFSNQVQIGLTPTKSASSIPAIITSLLLREE